MGTRTEPAQEPGTELALGRGSAANSGTRERGPRPQQGRGGKAWATSKMFTPVSGVCPHWKNARVREASTTLALGIPTAGRKHPELTWRTVSTSMHVSSVPPPPPGQGWRGARHKPRSYGQPWMCGRWQRRAPPGSAFPKCVPPEPRQGKKGTLRHVV